MSSSAAAATTASASSGRRGDEEEVIRFLRLNTLQDNPGAVKIKRRVGRGIGSSKGKTSGRGHKGQKARSGGSIHPLFEGGQTKLYKLLPKRGFNNKRHATPMVPVNLGTIQNYVEMGRLDPGKPITLREMQLAGMFKANAVKHGVKLLADGKEELSGAPLDIQVSRASKAAIEAVEGAGGTVTSVHYNKLALRALLRPEKFVVQDEDGQQQLRLPRRARPPPKFQPYYTSYKNRGYLNPVVQMRSWFQKQESERSFKELQEKFEMILQSKRKEQEDETP